jgi:hypothetical protein
MKVKRMVIGIDQSYTRTGISVCIDGKLKLVSSIDFKGLKSHIEKRKEVKKVLTTLLTKGAKKGLRMAVICERIRTFNKAQSKGKNKNGFGGLNPDYLKMTGALIATITDTAAEFGVKTYSVDTRSWKSKIVGNSKAKIINGKRDAKIETVNFIQNKYKINLFIRTNKNGVDLFNDDAADSACIALYGFINKADQKLKLEE